MALDLCQHLTPLISRRFILLSDLNLFQCSWGHLFSVSPTDLGHYLKVHSLLLFTVCMARVGLSRDLTLNIKAWGMVFIIAS